MLKPMTEPTTDTTPIRTAPHAAPAGDTALALLRAELEGARAELRAIRAQLLGAAPALPEGARAGRRRPTPRRLKHRAPTPGSTLRRTYQGKEYMVTVGKDGAYMYGGRAYHGLSTAARAIVGYPVNGWAFFGLAGRPVPAAHVDAPATKRRKVA